MIIKLHDNRLLANFNDSVEMSSGPEDLPDSSSLINLAISIIILLTYNLNMNTYEMIFSLYFIKHVFFSCPSIFSYMGLVGMQSHSIVRCIILYSIIVFF